ncbi:NAD(P)-binding domain protein [Cordyceps fumosorosea ARSEF 2679]|uniref:NAD(P)-binding domain protein n=1 Tax=Cordyceps fumosorosea (strain ARSEF 2679) TaxID=1081104 RepID=A0A167SVV8_CORFA|nr:NAD(P)-binding domain protein [Cordyceps fumosorosea ARSEF 2679]OAA59978.1 NAD(P)-binding domain protein [Cordyceps fumosorosea ARSEF 2679]
MAKVWLITGCSRGLGRALAEAVLELGDLLVATARDPSSLHDLVTRYGPSRVLATRLDVTDPSSAAAAVTACTATFGRLDVLVNNAGYAAAAAAVEDTSLASFRAQVEANFFGVVHVTKAALPTLRTQDGGGRIIQVSSVGGRVRSPGLAAYQSSKWAVGGFSTVLAAEVAPLGVHVTVLEPGGIRRTGSRAWAWRRSASRTARRCRRSVPEPPLRMLLGEDAVEIGKMAAKNLAASDEKWEQVARLKL